MMHEKTDHACHYEIYHRTEQTYKRLKNCKLVIVSSANYYNLQGSLTKQDRLLDYIYRVA